MTSAVGVSVVDLARRARLRVLMVALLTLVMAVLASSAGAALAMSGHLSEVGIGMGAVVMTVVISRHESAGVMVLLGIALVVEQFPLSGAHSAEIPFFTSLSDGAGLRGVYVNPAEVTILLVLMAWLIRGVARHRVRLPRSPLSLGFAVLLGLVVMTWFRGIAQGGDFRASLWEVRPWIYVATLYALTSQLITSRRGVTGLLWVVIIGTGIKGLQGAYLTLTSRNAVQHPEALLAHEESFFFGVYMALVLALWLFQVRGRLRCVATLLLPAVLLADLGNYRRVAWIILFAATLAVLVIAFVRLPARRGVVARTAGVILVAGAIYLPVFWNSTGTLGQPARAVRSMIAPDWRDVQSNAYRQVEDLDLGIDIRRSAPFGEGFGTPIQYPVPIADITNVDSFITYVPHDGLLYVWLRLGFPGALAFWWVVAAAILAGCALSRASDREISLYATLAVCVVLGYVIMGLYDMGLFWFRLAIVVGCLLGGLEAAQRLTTAAEGTRASRGAVR